jgi:hypothetical protein
MLSASAEGPEAAALPPHTFTFDRTHYAHFDVFVSLIRGVYLGMPK